MPAPQNGQVTTREVPLLSPGHHLGTYTIEDTIGAGGMAVVYRARHTVLESQHAIKVLDEKLRASLEVRQRFLNEGRIQARLRHPHITPVTDIISEPELGIAALVMPFLPGADLSATIGQVGVIPPEQAILWTRQILSALEYVHEQGVVHRDIKPSNIFLEMLHNGSRQVMVMDFGIAKVMDRSVTRTQMQMGSLGYMSPEQIQDAKRVDARSDLFMVGVVLYEMLSGKIAFNGDSDWTLMNNIVQGNVVPLQTLQPQMPPWLVSVVQTAMATDPARRFQTARLFADALKSPQPVPVAPREAAPQPSATASVYPGQVRQVGLVEMAWIPPGTFRMGSPESDPTANSNEKPQREVTIPQGFWMGTTPITQHLWQEVTVSNPSGFTGQDRRPVEQVSWCDAVVFANRLSQREGLKPVYTLPSGFVAGMDANTSNKLHSAVQWDREADGYRLPTEAEWEYAARAGTTTRYWSGDTEADLARVGWYNANSGKTTHMVGEKKAPNPWGLHDIHGNVFEWCFDTYDVNAYQSKNNIDPIFYGGSNRVVRGGSWDVTLGFARVANRNWSLPGGRWNNLGLRLVRSAVPQR